MWTCSVLDVPIVVVLVFFHCGSTNREVEASRTSLVRGGGLHIVCKQKVAFEETRHKTHGIRMKSIT